MGRSQGWPAFHFAHYQRSHTLLHWRTATVLDVLKRCIKDASVTSCSIPGNGQRRTDAGLTEVNKANGDSIFQLPILSFYLLAPNF